MLYKPELLTSKSQVMSLTGEDIEQGESTTIADGSENLYNHFENQFLIFSETGNNSTTSLSYITPRHTFQRMLQHPTKTLAHRYS